MVDSARSATLLRLGPLVALALVVVALGAAPATAAAPAANGSAPASPPLLLRPEEAAEALRLAHDLHLDRSVVLDTLEKGPLGFSVSQKKSMLASGDFEEATFSLDAMIKDLGLALDSAREELPITAATKAIADEASTAGHGDDDYASFAGYFSAEGRLNAY